MKTTVDIPEKELKECMRRLGAKTKKDAILGAVRRVNRSERLKEIADKLMGSCPNFMSDIDLKVVREDAKYESLPPWNPQT